MDTFRSRHLYIFTIFIVFFLTLQNNSSIQASNYTQQMLSIGTVGVEPIEPNQSSEFKLAKISVELLDPIPNLVRNKLTVTKISKPFINVHRHNNRFKFGRSQSLAILRDDGNQGDDTAGDNIFTGVAKIPSKTCGVIQTRVTGLVDKGYWRKKKVVSESFTLPLEALSNPAGTVLGTKIFEIEQGWRQQDSTIFNVPEAGEAILRVNNGAKIGSTFRERVAGAKISLNGIPIVHPRKLNKFVDCYEVRVPVEAGVNELSVGLVGKKGKHLAIQIDAPADKITLKPLPEPIVLGHDSLQAQATVTALGLPVENADVQFELDGAGVENTTQTGATGIASAFLNVDTVGEDTLRATVVGSHPILVDTTPIEVVAGQGLFLEHFKNSLWMQAGTERLVEFIIDVQTVNGASNHITLEHPVAPAGNGIVITPAGFSVDVATPDRIPFGALVTANDPGLYNIMTMATNTDTGATFNVLLPVEVVESGTPDPLILGTPAASPSGIEPDTLTTVTFHALADGTSTPPAVLFLDELDLAGVPLNLAVAELRDDGNGGDAIAGDLIYSGMVELSRPASEFRFRARSLYFGDEVLSGARTFLVTPFPQEARPSDPALLVPLYNSRVFSNEIQIKVIPGVVPDDVEEIAASINGMVVGVIAPLRMYLIEFPPGGSAEAVLDAITTVSAFSQVERASANFKLVNASITFNHPISPVEDRTCERTDTTPPCPNDGGPNNEAAGNKQWYLNKIGAREAWELVGGGSANTQVAIVDEGVQCDDHDDLDGQCTLRTGPGADSDHGTGIAGLIAAKANNTIGIAGIAWNTKLRTYAVGSGWDTAYTFSQVTNAKIITTSQLVRDPDKFLGLRDAICLHVEANRLVVVAGGQDTDELNFNDIYPARFNDKNLGEGVCPNSLRLMHENILAVGGTNRGDERGTFGPNRSNAKKWMDLYAPAVEILTLSGSNGTIEQQATSFAAPLVAGAAAVLWDNPRFTGPSETRAQAVHDRLKERGHDVDTDGWPFRPLVGNNKCENQDGGKCKRLNLLAAVTFPNRAPTANAGPDQDVGVFACELVTLDGNASMDPDGDSLTFNWTKDGDFPAGSTASLSDPTSDAPTFVADQNGKYQFKLKVNDGALDSMQSDIVTVTAQPNNAPVANAGGNQNLRTDRTVPGSNPPVQENTVFLDGGLSDDLDPDSLTYSWAFVQRPPGSSATLSTPNSVETTFEDGDRAGTYRISLTVDDGHCSSVAIVEVRVEDVVGPPAP